MPNIHNGLESPTLYVVVTFYKFQFYKIIDIANNTYKILNRVLENLIVKRIFIIYKRADFLILDIENDKKNINPNSYNNWRFLFNR